METRPVRLLCVDDNELVRQALERKFGGRDEFHWCGTLPDASALVARSLGCRPDVVLLDLDMPGPDPLVEMKRLLEALPDCRVLILSGRVSESLFDEALAAGAAGYLSKAEASAEIVDAVGQAAAGTVVIGNEVRIAVGLRPSIR